MTSLYPFSNPFSILYIEKRLNILCPYKKGSLMNHTNDMTCGNPLKALILFSLPLIAGNLFQHFYNLMDIAIVGNALGDDALSAVGATSALYGLFLSISFGFTNGFSLVIARYFGAKDEKNLKASIAHTMKMSIMAALILTIIAFFATKPLLALLKTPDIGESYRYISVVLFFLIFTVCYNMFSGILRAVGNSVAPLVFLVIGTLSNIGLDFLFICVFHMGVFGAGLATVMSQAVSCVISGWFLLKKCKNLLPSKEDFRTNASMSKELFTNGLSMALMLSIVSIGSISLQYAVNSLGPVTVTAHTTARKIDETMMLVFFPLSTAAATFCSQNLGAGKPDRIKKGIATAFFIGGAVSVIMTAVTFLYGETLVRLISGSKNSEVIRLGSLYLKYNIPFYFFLIVLVILRSTLQGLGSKILPVIASITELIGKVVFALLLVPQIGYRGVIFSEPVIWIIGAVIVGSGFLVLLTRISHTSYRSCRAISTDPQHAR